jgi:hypothetical protein
MRFTVAAGNTGIKDIPVFPAILNLFVKPCPDKPHSAPGSKGIEPKFQVRRAIDGLIIFGKFAEPASKTPMNNLLVVHITSPPSFQDS